MLSLLRLERKPKQFWIRIFLFLSYSFGIETIKTFINSRSSIKKPYPIPHLNGQSVHPFLDQNGAKTLPDRAAHTYMAHIREYLPPRASSPLQGSEGRKFEDMGGERRRILIKESSGRYFIIRKVDKYIFYNNRNIHVINCERHNLRKS